MKPISKIVVVGALGLGVVFANAAATGKIKPHPGSIVAIGGDEDKTRDMVVLKSMLAEAKGKKSNVVVITTASAEPERRRTQYGNALRTLGVDHYKFIYIDNRNDAFDPKVYNTLKGADVVFFSGGDQLRLTSLLGGTPFLEKIREMNKKGTVVGGTSAGGAVLSDLMVYDGTSEQAAVRGEILMTRGFRFVDNVAFDTHFMNRDRLQRLFNMVATNPEILGIGMDEDTGVIFHHGGEVFEVIGKGHVTVVDGSRMETDYYLIERGEAATYNNVNVHTLAAGERFNIRTRDTVAIATPSAPQPSQP